MSPDLTADTGSTRAHPAGALCYLGKSKSKGKAEEPASNGHLHRSNLPASEQRRSQPQEINRDDVVADEWTHGSIGSSRGRKKRGGKNKRRESANQNGTNGRSNASIRASPSSSSSISTTTTTTTTGIPHFHTHNDICSVTFDPKNLFVKYLPKGTDDTGLRDMFMERCEGVIVSCKVMLHQNTMESLGYGFVRYQTESQAQGAVDLMDGYRIGGKKLLCRLSNLSSSSIAKDVASAYAETGFESMAPRRAINRPYGQVLHNASAGQKKAPPHATAKVANGSPTPQLPPYPNKTLFVSRLPSFVSKRSDLRNMFSRFGKIVDVKLMNDRRYGFVEFDHIQDAVRAQQVMHCSIPSAPNNSKKDKNANRSPPEAEQQLLPLKVTFSRANNPPLNDISTPPPMNMMPYAQFDPQPMSPDMIPTSTYPTIMYPPHPTAPGDSYYMYPSAYYYYYGLVPYPHSPVAKRNGIGNNNNGNNSSSSSTMQVSQTNVASLARKATINVSSAASLPVQGQKHLQQTTSANLFVFHLPASVDDEALLTLFSPFGEIENHKVMVDKTTGKSKGYGFVKYASMDAAMKAVSDMNGHRVDKKHLKVSFHHSKPVKNGSQKPAAPSPTTHTHPLLLSDGIANVSKKV